MPEFISRPRESQLAALIAQMKSRQMDPIAQGILQAGQSIGSGIAAGGANARAERARKAAAETTSQGNIMDLLGKGGSFTSPDGTPMDIGSMLPSLGLPTGSRYSPPVKEKPIDTDALTDSERMLWASKLKLKPEQLVGVRLSALKGLSEEKKPSDAGLTESQKMVDRQFGKEYADFVLAGGYADVQKQLGQLRGVIGELTGTGTAEKPQGVNASGLSGILWKGARDVIAPKGAAIQDSVEEVVQRNLRNVLGAQFTEREGTRLIERAYNPRQPEAENIKRLTRLVNQIDEAAKSKAEAGAYYEKNGTLVGFKGKMFRSADDFLRDAVKDTKDGKTEEAITIVDSSGKEHRILKKNLEAAKKRDAGLKVKE